MSTPETPAPETAAGGACPRCGAPLRPDQDWCLQCGAAVTTHVAGAPGWRTPVAIVGAVLAVAAVLLVVAFLELSDDAEQEVARVPTPTPTASAAPTVTPTPTTSPGVTPTPSASPDGGVSPLPLPDASPSPSPSPGASPSPGPTVSPTSTPGGSGTVASWPAGRTAYTVILASETSRSAAETKARRFGTGGRSVGVLDSDDFKSLRGGYFVVFSGQYDDLDAARSAAQTFRSDAPDAYARRIVPK